MRYSDLKWSQVYSGLRVIQTCAPCACEVQMKVKQSSVQVSLEVGKYKTKYSAIKLRKLRSAYDPVRQPQECFFFPDGIALTAKIFYHSFRLECNAALWLFGGSSILHFWYTCQMSCTVCVYRLCSCWHKPGGKDSNCDNNRLSVRHN